MKLLIQFLEMVLKKYQLMVYKIVKKNNSFYHNMPMKFQITHSQDIRTHICRRILPIWVHKITCTALQAFG